jgi:hypothetical protein
VTLARTERRHCSAPPCSRDEAKRAASRAFDRAIRACGYTNAFVAGLLDVSESRVRKQRSDDDADLDVVPSTADIILADHELGERYIQELRAERLKVHGAAPIVTVEQKAMQVLGSDARVSSSIATALMDGAIDGPEQRAIVEALRESEQAREQLNALLARRGR